MKHVVAILAHKNPEHLLLLVNECIARGYHPMVHIDSKSKDRMLNSYPQLASYTIETSINVKRAHISIVEATISLINAAREEEYDYFHLISGEDFIVKSAEEFEYFFTANNGLNFINRLQVPVRPGDDKYDRHLIFKDYSVYRDCVPPANYRYWDIDGGVGFLERYHPTPGSVLHRLIEHIGISYQVRRLIYRLLKRKAPQLNYHTGSAWFSVTKKMTTHILKEWNEQTGIRAFFQNVLFPDEILIHTFAQSYNDQESLINSDLRYINWDNSVNHGPSLLGPEHLSDIKQSNGFFARKMDVSNGNLLDQIKKELL